MPASAANNDEPNNNSLIEFMKRSFLAAAATLLLISCGGGGGGGDDATASPIDRYVGRWERCDMVGSIYLGIPMLTTWTITKSGSSVGELVVEETANACNGTRESRNS